MNLTRWFIVERRGKKDIDILKIGIFSVIAVFLATYIHELGHVIMLRMIGCQPYMPSIFFMFGLTPYECGTHEMTPLEWSLAALAGPLFSFIVALFVWNYNKDSIARLFALNLFFYGTLPNLIWQIPGTDAYFAVTHGFNPMIMTIIAYTTLVLTNYLVAREIVELE